MNSLAKWCVTQALLCTLVVPRAPATTYQSVDLKACVGAADVIFAGTVTRMVAVMDSGAIITRVTFSDVVHVRGKPDSGDVVLKVLGGQVGDRGLFVGDEDPQFENAWRYVVLATGDLGSRRTMYTPIVFYNQGVFTVKPERPGSSPVVFYNQGVFAVGPKRPRSSPAAYAGLPIAAYRDGHVVLVSRPSPGDSLAAPGLVSSPALRPSGSPDTSALRPFVMFGIRGRAAWEVVDSRADPGTRFSEEQFLALLREIGKER